MGEGYDSIHVLADLFASLKYPTSFLAPLPGNGCCSNFKPSWSSYLFFFKLKKFLSFFFFPYLYLGTCHPHHHRIFLLSLSLPRAPLPMEGYPRTHLPTLWGESLKPSSQDLVPHPAMRFIPKMCLCRGKLRGVFTEEYASTLTTVL